MTAKDLSAVGQESITHWCSSLMEKSCCWRNLGDPPSLDFSGPQDEVNHKQKIQHWQQPEHFVSPACSFRSMFGHGFPAGTVDLGSWAVTSCCQTLSQQHNTLWRLFVTELLINILAGRWTPPAAGQPPWKWPEAGRVFAATKKAVS